MLFTYEALIDGLTGNGKVAPAATTGMPKLPDDDLIMPTLFERDHILMSFGLTERDLDYMGDEQRAKVDEVVEHVMAAHAFA